MAGWSRPGAKFISAGRHQSIIKVWVFERLWQPRPTMLRIALRTIPLLCLARADLMSPLRMRGQEITRIVACSHKQNSWTNHMKEKPCQKEKVTSPSLAKSCYRKSPKNGDSGTANTDRFMQPTASKNEAMIIQQYLVLHEPASL